MLHYLVLRRSLREVEGVEWQGHMQAGYTLMYNHTGICDDSMAQWIRRWSTEPEILGSIPSGVGRYFCVKGHPLHSRGVKFYPTPQLSALSSPSPPFSVRGQDFSQDRHVSGQHAAAFAARQRSDPPEDISEPAEETGDASIVQPGFAD